eukprot:8878_1
MKNKNISIDAKIYLLKMISVPNQMYDQSHLLQKSIAYEEKVDFINKRECYTKMMNSADNDNDESKLIRSDQLYQILQKYFDDDVFKKSIDDNAFLFVDFRMSTNDFYDAFFAFYDERCMGGYDEEKEEFNMKYPLSIDKVIGLIFDSKHEEKTLSNIIEILYNKSQEIMLNSFDFLAKKDLYLNLSKAKNQLTIEVIEKILHKGNYFTD